MTHIKSCCSTIIEFCLALKEPDLQPVNDLKGTLLEIYDEFNVGLNKQ